MTELLTRPASAHAGDDAARPAAPSLWGRGCLAAGWSVAVGGASLLVLALFAWAAASRAGSSAGEATRAALQIWLAGHHVPLAVRGGSVNLAPLLLTLALAF